MADETDEEESVDDIGFDGTVMSDENYFDDCSDYSVIECEVS